MPSSTDQPVTIAAAQDAGFMLASYSLDVVTALGSDVFVQAFPFLSSVFGTVYFLIHFTTSISEGSRLLISAIGHLAATTLKQTAAAKKDLSKVESNMLSNFVAETIKIRDESVSHEGLFVETRGFPAVQTNKEWLCSA